MSASGSTPSGAKPNGPPFGREATLDLMAYADGELTGEALERVEAWLARDAEAARWVEEFRTLSACISVSERARPVPKSVDSIADAVMAKVASISLERPNDVPKVVRIRRAFAAGAVSVALAMAAGWVLFLRTPGEPEDHGATMAANVATPEPELKPAPEPDPKAVEAPPPAGVELEDVESPSREISVFYVPGVSGEAASSIVVWVGEDSKSGSK